MKVPIPGWMKKKQEMLIVLALALVMILLIFYGLKQQKSFIGGGDSEPVAAPEKVKLTSKGKGKDGEGASGNGGGGDGKNGSSNRISTYFLKPTPAEVMEMVKEIVDSELPVPKEKYENLRIVWPVYFFQQTELEPGKVTVQFDTSQDGFGVNLITTIDSLKYPEILHAEPYQKMWLAGAIEGIDASGTGTIHMQTEQVRFQDELPEVQKALEAQADRAE